VKVGDVVLATWSDGLTAIGRYSEKKQGYVILLGGQDEDRVIVCDPSHVSFEILQDKNKKISDNRAKT